MAAALPDCTADEIADVLWLLTALDTRTEAAPVTPGNDERPDPLPTSPGEQVPAEAEDTEETPEPTEAPLALAEGADSGPGGRMVRATEVGLRSPNLASRPLSAARALSEFKRIHRPGPPTVDVEATVEATADARRLVVVTSPGRERGLDVALVVDSSPVMTICHGELAEFEALLRRAGAFRSVTRWTLVPDSVAHQPPGGRAPGLGSDVRIRDSAGADHHPDRLLDPAGRRLVLLATDAVADHWYRPGVWQTMERWARVMPTAVLDVLPEQYRAQTALGMSVAVMRSRLPAGPNAAADIQVAWWESDPHPDGSRLAAVPLPVVALRAQALEVWAEAVVAAGTVWVDAVWARQPPGPPPGVANAQLTAADRVHAFQARASRDAQALAQILAMAPVLTLPLIRVLQKQLLPGTGSSELAEVLIGGLIERAQGRASRDKPERLRFRPMVRELLLRGMTAAREWDTYRVITEYLRQDARTGGDISALLADPEGTAEIDAALAPFAALGHEVASRLGLVLGDSDEPGGQGGGQDGPVPEEPGEPSTPENRWIPLPGSERTPLAGAKESARQLDGSERIEVTLITRRRNDLPAGYVTGPATLTRDQLEAQHGTDPADLALIGGVLGRFGIEVTGADAGTRRVTAAGPVSAFSAAFGVSLRLVDSYAASNGSVAQHRYRVGGLHVPAELGGVVLAVLGLDDRPQASPHIRWASGIAAAAGVAGPASYTPVQVAQAYNFPAGTEGTGQILAIIELGGGFSSADLGAYFSGLGIITPSVTTVGVDGGVNVAGQDPQGADGEVLLDIQVAGAAAPGALQVVYFAPNTDRGFVDAVATAVHANPTPTAVSISWGQSEDSWTGQARAAMDQAFADAAALGVTVTASAGDNGSSDLVSDGQAHVDFPASSPHALACGGTSLRLDPATASISAETVWNDGPSGGATGGGVSDTFGLPAWQAPVGVPGRAGSGYPGRGVPDVAGHADPQTGYQVLVDGRSQVVGGTSAVAPLWAALICRLAQVTGKSFGLIQPLLYAGASSGATPAGFRDITEGNNGAYQAGPGWDACTGLGVPDGTALAGRLSG